MANVTVIYSQISIIGRYSSSSLKSLRLKSLLSRSLSLSSSSYFRMSSSTSSTPGNSVTESVDEEVPCKIILERPSIIKSGPAVTVVSSPTADNVTETNQDVIRRPSVICSVKNSVFKSVEIPVIVPIPTRTEIKTEAVDSKTTSAKALPFEPQQIDFTPNSSSTSDKSKSDNKESEVEQLEAKKITPDDDSTNSSNSYVRIKKRKVVLLLSYSGAGYFGMQRNPGTKTIEDELFHSLLKNNYIDEDIYNRPQLINFQRASRTDKNVSAARQIVSLKLPENACIEKINEFLPSQIRVFAMKRVTKNFDSKNKCDARTYSYMLPTFAFAPIETIITEAYRVTPEIIEIVRAKLNSYVGCKNYHNFTSRKKPGDPSAQRNILSFTCSDPFIQEGLEYVILRVKGQSFMMHQIRKMIGLVVAVVRGFANDEVIDKAFTLDRIDIPRAPGLGLLLDRVHFERYDKKFGKDGCHECLSWEDVEDKIEEFCKTHIYTTVTKTENEEKSMINWLATLPYHTYDVREHEPLSQEADDDEIVDGEPRSVSRIGKALHAISRAQKKLNNVVDNDDESEVGGDDDEEDEEIPKAKKFKQES